jgi:hypothetical protein
MNTFPNFDDSLDSSNVGSILENKLSIQVGITSIYLEDISNHLVSIVSQSPEVNGNSSLSNIALHLWDFSRSSESISNSRSCYRDFARKNGTERDGEGFVQFNVCAVLGEGFITTSPFVVPGAALQNFSASKNLKTRGWRLEHDEYLESSPPPGKNFFVGDEKTVFLYNDCGANSCGNHLWIFLPTKRGSSWKSLPVVPSPSWLSNSFSEVPSFQGPTVQYQDGRLYVIGGNLRSSSQSIYTGRFTVATFDLNADKSQVMMNLFLFQDYSAVVDSVSVSNGTHAFVFGGKIGWGRAENSVLVLSFLLMTVTKLLAAPIAPVAALFSGVIEIDFFCE